MKHRNKKSDGFTLAEVLITLSIIGVVAALTIPNLIQSYQEREMVTKLLKFNTNLQQAVKLWKADIGCYSDAYTCLKQQNLSDSVLSNFDQLSKFLRAKKYTDYNKKTTTYSGDAISYYSINSFGNGRYILDDGTVFTIDVDPTGFWLVVDLNGTKPPNRVGKDTFHMTIGYIQGKDINYYRRDSGESEGICGLGYNAFGGPSPIPYPCSANNTDPTKLGGASPTAYVIMNHKLPDFKELSKTVPGFLE